jgi:hypothetical protein
VQDDSISSLHFEMRLNVEMDGNAFQLFSPEAACGSACRRADVTVANNNVDILRFAKSGKSEAPLGALSAPMQFGGRLLALVGRVPTMEWLVTMQDGAHMAGYIDRAPLAAGQPAPFSLHGRMLLQFQVAPAGKPTRLLSRIKPNFLGTVTEWPPRRSVLNLSNGPIDYYREEEVEKTGATPVLRILSNTVSFGSGEVGFLVVRPEITEAQIISRQGAAWTAGEEVGGVSLRWTDTRGLVPQSDPPVRFYHVYRRFDDDDLNSWVRVRTLPADVLTWTDDTYSGHAAARYVVLHAAEYPFGYKYESLIGRAVTVPAVLS